MDVLATKDYEKHHRFYFSLVTSLLFSLVTWLVLFHLHPLFSYINFLIYEYELEAPFLILTLGNNIYQVYAHIFTGTKFLGYKQIVPHGSRDKQTLKVFTISNIFDILGWLTIFVYYKQAHPVLAILAAIHYGSGIVSIFFNSTFQRYYIENGSQIDNTDNFGYLYWKLFRASFVFVDALARGYVSYSIISKFWIFN